MVKNRWGIRHAVCSTLLIVKKIQGVIFGLVVTLRVCSAASQEPLAKFLSLRVLDFPIPFCENSVKLDVARDHFVEIENDLPGRSEYNNLVRLFQKKNWFDYTASLGLFRKQFESSPLIEAVEFLDLQSEIERLNEKSEAGLQKVENKFRDLLILYPRSTLNPVLQASMANIYLRMGAYAKALGLYRVARQDSPFHSTSCTHLFGEAEANYLLGNFDESTQTFRAVLQKCESNRLQVAAKVRLVDIQREQSKDLKSIEKDYEKIREDNPTLVSRFHPELLYNLGEIKYRSKSFPSSTFYFNDFSRNVTDTHVCQPKLQKRLADLSRQNKKKNVEVIGLYLSVYEKYPKSDLGRFSRVHALLLDFASVSDAEAKRRLEIIDSELAAIRERGIRDYAAIEKGLAILDRKDDTGLEVLKPLRERLETVFSGELDNYIRTAFLDQVKGPFPEIASLSDKAKDKKVLEPLERAFTDWFSKTPDSERAELVYRSLIMTRFREAMESGNVKSALYKLERWKDSDLFQKKWVDSKTRKELGGQLANWWVRQPMGSTVSISKFFIDRSEGINNFFSPEGDALWVQVYMELNDTESLEKALKMRQKERAVAAKKSSEDARAQSAYSLILGRAFRLVKDFKQSEFYLNQVTSTELDFEKNVEKMKTFSSEGKAKEAIQLGLKTIEQKPANQIKEVLPLLRDAVVLGKAWNYSDSVSKIASKTLGEDKALVPFLTMKARALLEQGKFKDSYEGYLHAMKMDSDAKDIAETKFNMARCLIKLKDVESAKKEWEEVAALNDEFWSPLAANELKLLEKP